MQTTDQVQDQGGGMNDAQIRDKVKREADKTGKLRRQNVQGVAYLSRKMFVFYLCVSKVTL